MTGKNADKGNSLNHTGFCGIMNMEKYMYKAGDILDGTYYKRQRFYKSF